MNEKSKKSTKADAKLMEQLSLPIKDDAEANENESSGEDFEESLKELEAVVMQLEGELKLEEALSLFDRGMKLSKSCEESLKIAEQKIEILKKAANGKLLTEKFNEDAIQN